MFSCLDPGRVLLHANDGYGILGPGFGFNPVSSPVECRIRVSIGIEAPSNKDTC
jgi:hypothetical protein